jgi:thiol-disulfide isomerase/thioredoxin
MLPPSSQNKIMILGLLVVLILSPIALTWYINKQSSHDSFPLGMKVHSFVVSTLNGTTFPLNYHGKKQLLIFFTAECSSCRSELLNLELLYTQYNSQVEFFAISLSKKEITMMLLSSQSFPFPVFLLNRTTLQDSMKIVNVPTIVYIDDHRIIRHVFVGERTLKEDKTLIQNFCGESFIQKK